MEMHAPAPAEDVPSVSIVIATYNRAEMLRKALFSLDALDYPRNSYDVIIADDGSEDATREIVEQTKQEISYDLAYHRQENRKAGAARNLGIRQSRGEIIVFVDDDMIMPREWLRTLVRPFREDPGVGAAGGPGYYTPDEVSLLSRGISYALTSFLGTAGVHGTTKVRWARFYPRSGNMAARRDVLKEVGMFNEKIFPAEDIDLVFRIRKAGYKLVFVDAPVQHFPRTSVKGFFKQVVSWGYMRMELFRRYREFREYVYAVPALSIVLFLALLLLSAFSPEAGRILLFLVGVYALLLLANGVMSTVKIRNLKTLVLVPFLIFLQNAGYGLGFLASIFRIRIGFIRNYASR